MKTYSFQVRRLERRLYCTISVIL